MAGELGEWEGDFLKLGIGGGVADFENEVASGVVEHGVFLRDSGGDVDGDAEPGEFLGGIEDGKGASGLAVSFDEEGGEAGEAGGVTTEAAGGAAGGGDVRKGGGEGDLVDEFVLVQRAAKVEGAAIEGVRGHGEWHVFGGAFRIGGGGAIETFEDVFDVGVDG